MQGVRVNPWTNSGHPGQLRGFFFAFLNASRFLPAENGTGAPRVQEYQLKLDSLDVCSSTPCIAPLHDEEWYLLDSTQLGAELLLLLLKT